MGVIHRFGMRSPRFTAFAQASREKPNVLMHSRREAPASTARWISCQSYLRAKRGSTGNPKRRTW